jgi:transposase-like protein
MTDHTPMPKISRLDVISTGARRRWTLAEKQRIVAESYDGRRQVSAVAMAAARAFRLGICQSTITATRSSET